MKISFSLLLTIGLASCSMISCPRQHPPPDIKPMTLEQAHGRLMIESKRRQRVAGLFKARLGGMAGLVASADLDVIAEAPTRLHLAVQSFFGQPIQVLATDGDLLTLYDARAEAGPHFFSGPASPRAAEHLLGIPLSVDEVVAAVLGRIPPDATPLAHAQQAGGERYTVVYELSDQGRASVTADRNDVILQLAVNHADGSERYALTYSNFRDESGVQWASDIEVRATVAGQPERLTLTAREISVNGPTMDDGVFSVGLPPGESFAPLPGETYQAPLGSTAP